ncbi:type IX secretion system membrane protein PorP/SprF [Maribacter algarum]|uniref:Type IX secretion system membrane protein PorP/SprF n=1 Tax=Maribacter algarum (ex Zhang et al. 2020) TaxID=2578118 RepID=A0A5S3PT98_9FLAO|nr:PorP/SprF family type IX secretion system membrane protein [Maribacter algarum]TMM58211.1 type IX secretion system membrane protein PorP/SprF [Maribacter algarum]
MSFRFFIVAILLGVACYAQQTPVFSEYNYNPFLINSAHAGALQNAEISLTHSGLFSTIDGSPKSSNVSFRTPLANKQMGLGGGFIHDEIGVTTTTSTFAAYSYRIPLNLDDEPYWKVQEPTGISFGLTIGFQKYQENLLGLGLGTDPLLSQNINATLPMVGAGIVLNYAKFYIGLSTPNLLGDRFASEDNLDLQSPYYAYIGYRFYFSRFENVLLKPNVLLKYENGAPIQADLNLSFTMNSKLEFGLGYRTNSSLNILAGVYLFESLRIIYSYNVASKNLSFGNTHGIVLSYRFNRGYSRN